MKKLTFVLAAIAGSTDVIGFLTLNGLFTAHITGNLVILAAHVVNGAEAPLAHMLAVPVFVAALAATRLVAAGLERCAVPALRPLLLAQLVLLGAFLAVGLAAGDAARPTVPAMIFAAMLGVSAMAVQSALVKIALEGAPATTVLTTNITLLTMDLGEMLLGRDASRRDKARDRARRTWPAVAGFIVGSVLGAAGEAGFGLQCLVAPIALAFVATAMGVQLDRQRASPPSRSTSMDSALRSMPNGDGSG